MTPSSKKTSNNSSGDDFLLQEQTQAETYSQQIESLKIIKEELLKKKART